MSEASPPQAPTTKDRTTALTVVGSLQVALGVLAACFVPLALLPLTPAFRRQMEQTQGAPPDPRGVAFGVAFYGLVALFFMWTGVGAIRKRRWVRPILLSVSWIWLLCGVLGSIFGLLVLPRVLRATFQRTPGLPPGMGWIIGILVATFIAFFYLLLPLGLILFYRSPRVRATLEARDPRPRWTDACPIPVLAMAIYLEIGALGMLLVARFAVFPVFTVLMTGPAAVACALALAACYAYLSRSAYRLEPIGWWGPLVIFTLLPVSTAVYFRFGDMTAYLAAAGVRGEQGRLLAESGIFGGAFLVVGGSVWLALVAGYFAWVRKYFNVRDRR